MSNYRPISLLLSCSKILETIMFNRLYQYVHTNGILAPEQFGFRKESNIEKAVFSLTDSVLSSLNLQQQIRGHFLWSIQGFWLCKSQDSLSKIMHTMEFVERAWIGSKLILLTGNKRSKLQHKILSTNHFVDGKQWRMVHLRDRSWDCFYLLYMWMICVVVSTDLIVL